MVCSSFMAFSRVKSHEIAYVHLYEIPLLARLATISQVLVGSGARSRFRFSVMAARLLAVLLPTIKTPRTRARALSLDRGVRGAGCGLAFFSSLSLSHSHHTSGPHKRGKESTQQCGGHPARNETLCSS